MVMATMTVGYELMMVITMLVIVIEVVVRNHRAPGSIPARGPSVALSTIVMHRCPYRCIGIGLSVLK